MCFGGIKRPKTEFHTINIIVFPELEMTCSAVAITYFDVVLFDCKFPA